MALLAIGVQLVLPLSVGVQIVRQGGASTLSIFQTALCVVGHAANLAQTDNNSGSKPVDPRNDNPAAGCPLCLALQVMHAFTDAPAAPLPLPSVIAASPTHTTPDIAASITHSSPYNSRAPPVMA